MANIYAAIDDNKRKSWIIMGLFVTFIILITYLFIKILNLSSGYITLAVLFSIISSLGSYFYSDKIVLGISGARPADRKKDFQFYTVTENLCLATQLPMPKLYVINDSAPNAFATGRNPQNSSVCATTGILEKLNRTELEGVIGHELSHIKNYDTRLMVIVSVLIGIVALLSDWFMRSLWFNHGNDRDENRSSNSIGIFLAILVAILSPLIGKLIQLAISRRREFYADASSAYITRQPSGLISALKKITADKEVLEAANRATAHLYIINPFKANARDAVSRFSYLFDTHPPLNERIKALETLTA